MKVKNCQNSGSFQKLSQFIKLEILDAYNCLTDVNERSWYDNHRERILRGNKEDMTKEELDE